MPTSPPETQFYDNPDNAELWRDISRLFEDFLPDTSERLAVFSEERIERFLTVLSDVQNGLEMAQAEAATQP